MFKLLKRIGKKWWLLLVLALFIILQVACEVALPTVMGEGIRIIQNINTVSDQESYTVLIAIVIFAAGALISSIIVGLLTSKVASVILSNTRKELYEKIAQFSSNEMNKFSTTSLLTRMTNDFTQVNLFLNYAGRYIIYGPLIAIYALVIMLVGPNQEQGASPWRIPWEIMILIGALLVVVLTLIGIVVKLAFKRQIEIQTRMDHLNLLTRENLEGLRVVRAYNAENYQEEKYLGYNEKLNKVNKFTNRMIAIFNPAIMFLAAIMTICIGWIGAKMVSEGSDATARSQLFANITVYTQFAGLIIAGIVLAIFAFTTLPKALTSTKRIFEVLNTEVTINDGVGVEVKEIGTIEFKNVTYTYPGADIPVVKNLSFKVNKGETLAFIGATGSGKSTVVNLLLRFMDPTEGEILVDGVNVKDYKLNDLFKRFGYVPQKGYLFHDSLRNNVCVGKRDATEEQFVRAIEISQSADFVAKLPNQYEYEVSQGGRNVSGGQRQRLCIARAIIMEPEIFVFDDSFSALDYRTDKILRRTIKERCEGTTNVIVAQRVGTIIDADQIIVLDAGNVVGRGKHDELLKNCPVYQEIANSQLGKEGK